MGCDSQRGKGVTAVTQENIYYLSFFFFLFIYYYYFFFLLYNIVLVLPYIKTCIIYYSYVLTYSVVYFGFLFSFSFSFPLSVVVVNITAL